MKSKLFVFIASLFIVCSTASAQVPAVNQADVFAEQFATLSLDERAEIIQKILSEEDNETFLCPFFECSGGATWRNFGIALAEFSLITAAAVIVVGGVTYAINPDFAKELGGSALDLVGSIKDTVKEKILCLKKKKIKKVE